MEPIDGDASFERPGENLLSKDWAALRGEKWRAHEDGMEAMLSPLDEPLIRALRLNEPCRIADIGCGSGGTSLALLRHVPEGSLVQGFDLSAHAIESARERVRGAGVSFTLMDVAERTPPLRFDRMASRFGVMFFDNPRQAFANLREFLEPGGRFAFAVWGRKEENEWMTSVREVVEKFVTIPPSDPEGPGPFRYANAAGLLSVLAEARLEELDTESWQGVLPIGGMLSPSEAASFALASFSSFAELLSEAGPSAMEAAHALVTARFQPHYRDGSVWMGAQVHIVTGTRSGV